MVTRSSVLQFLLQLSVTIWADRVLVTIWLTSGLRQVLSDTIKWQDDRICAVMVLQLTLWSHVSTDIVGVQMLMWWQISTWLGLLLMQHCTIRNCECISCGRNKLVLCWIRTTSIHHTKIGNFCHNTFVTGWALANCEHLVSEQLILSLWIAKSVTQMLLSTLDATSVTPFP